MGKTFDKTPASNKITLSKYLALYREKVKREQQLNSKTDFTNIENPLIERLKQLKPHNPTNTTIDAILKYAGNTGLQ